MSTRKDVIVVGAGVIGCSIAELIETGKTPLRARRMFECLAPGTTSG